MSDIQISKLEIIIEDYPDMDTGYLGEYLPNWSGIWDIHVETGQFIVDMDDDEIGYESDSRKFFSPYVEEARPGSEIYRKVAMERFKRMQDYEKGDFSFLSIHAKAIVQTKTNGTFSFKEYSSNGLHGIESDCGIHHIKQMAKEQLAQLQQKLFDKNIDDPKFIELAEKGLEDCMASKRFEVQKKTNVKILM